ncbi:protein DedA [Clostridium pasteurianum DSM 525 = ATCC 6013]|uniref:Protein DedA n=2 Tax=Clostridium pasteurianum TaxID=1501 RepID=A0A0H3J884_CLOPA|nr:protein DedA [Clostridium pasteurianum DSM 525 = ATCC 6013]AJA53647.1 protein DedA [Clostridium pasteurianum DSM 525 = ATCC 6013]ELP58826.1 hypothetical protein F502_11896 [Clostridium pasteurianum DSM 525 = ATCC 6013]KRU14328.1 SNARE associated protein [Clostridium pasteurianum DSM 525 = ATCC 6013]
MEKLINTVLHFDKYLNIIIQNYGSWTYVLLFLIIFCETGLVVTPFLPGDSLIFATGALAARGSLSIITLYIIFLAAAIIGDTVNYHIGKKIGIKIFEREDLKYINKEHLKKAESFYKKHGSMTIVLGRFIPIIRTFVPFVAGIGEMHYSKFIVYNILGGSLWVSLFLIGGYFFGNLPIVEENFSYVVISIIAISIIPAIIAFIREKKNSKTQVLDMMEE